MQDESEIYILHNFYQRRINLTTENYLDINTLFIVLNKIDSNNKLTAYPDIVMKISKKLLYKKELNDRII